MDLANSTIDYAKVPRSLLEDDELIQELQAFLRRKQIEEADAKFNQFANQWQHQGMVTDEVWLAWQRKNICKERS